MDSNQKHRRRVLAPNVITAFGLCCGLFIIFKSMFSTSSQQELVHQLQGLAILLICSMIADFSDGAIARLMKAESDFGEQFDSLSDAITFGIAPSLIVIKSTQNISSGKLFSSVLLICSMIYSLCGVLRLVRFTIMKKAPKSGHSEKNYVPKGFFQGLPIPAAAGAIVSLALFLTTNVASHLADNLRLSILCAGQLLIGCLMVSKWHFPSLGALRFRVSSFLFIAVTGIFTGILFAGIMDHFIEAFFIVAWLYILVLFPLSLFLNPKSKS